jgi:hypothetical protein
MNPGNARRSAATRKRRRWLMGLEPIFEGGWLHRGTRARTWDVEAHLVAVALFGDVTVDLAGANSLQAETAINAWAIFRDVEVLVAAGDRVQLTGRGEFGDLTNQVLEMPEDGRGRAIRIHGHSLFGDVTWRVVPDQS